MRSVQSSLSERSGFLSRPPPECAAAESSTKYFDEALPKDYCPDMANSSSSSEELSSSTSSGIHFSSSSEDYPSSSSSEDVPSSSTSEELSTSTSSEDIFTSTSSSSDGDDVEIQFNESSEAKEAVVRLKSKVPKKDFETKCRIRWVGPERSSYITAVLKNPDKRLGFSETELQLPPDGDWVDFSIYGDKKSEKAGDAKLKVHENSGSGPLLCEADVTVYFFEPADITVGKGKNLNYEAIDTKR